MPEKFIREACQLTMAVDLAFNTRGSVFAKGCHGVTTNLNHTCSACTAVEHLEGLKHGVRRAGLNAQLPPDEFSKRMPCFQVISLGPGENSATAVPLPRTAAGSHAQNIPESDSGT
ncbi:hypothetical protein B0H13DRAFT_1925140 [Mycena leptocephala]|nr:hypothetical protein B0H13DRAFT_1925140 [Mycena leptocephala]